MNWNRRMLVILALAVLPLSCKVKYSMSGISIPDDVKTITVGFFPNEAEIVNPLLSQLFTETLKNKFINETKLDLVQSGGDFQFSGAITDYKVIATNVQENTTSSGSKFIISVKVDFTCETHPNMNFSKVFPSDELFSATQSFESVENELTQVIVDEIIQDIFNKTALQW